MREELELFLEQKPLYYNKIDYERIKIAYSKIEDKLNFGKALHVVGTNGKGSTGRFLAVMLKNLGFKVGHYSSPHILEFNERIWLNGSYVDNKSLNIAHAWLLNAQNLSEELSYFEYTTLLALKVFEGCDYVVLEAGLGGVHDATCVVKKELSLFTPIDFDHQAFLGDTIESIATNKLSAMQKCAIVGEQTHKNIIEIAQKIAKEKSVELLGYKELLVDKDLKNAERYIEQKNYPSYFIQNLLLAIAAFKKLGFEFKNELLEGFFLRGRFEWVAKNIIIDVGHNPLSARAIKDALKTQKITLVYGSLKDKDYKNILNILKPVIKNIELIEIDDKRALNLEILEEFCKDFSIPISKFDKIQDNKNYLVYGSFYVIEKFLKDWERYEG